jgi:hypothetical protein
MKISVFWLRLVRIPIGKSGIGKGISVKGSTTSPNKISILKVEFILLITLESDRISGQSRIFKGSTILIDIPPKLRGINKENFVSKIEILIPFIEKSTLKTSFH